MRISILAICIKLTGTIDPLITWLTYTNLIIVVKLLIHKTSVYILLNTNIRGVFNITNLAITFIPIINLISSTCLARDVITNQNKSTITETLSIFQEAIVFALLNNYTTIYTSIKSVAVIT